MKCIAKNISPPAPSFLWTVDNVTLDHGEVDKYGVPAIFTQILHFQPVPDQANKTLRCTVRHPGLEREISASTEIRLTKGILGILRVEVDASVAVLVLFAFSMFIYIYYKRPKICNANTWCRTLDNVA